MICLFLFIYYYSFKLASFAFDMSNNTFALIIDTSSEKPFLILVENHTPLAFKELSAKGKNFTYQLLPEIKNLLKEEKCSLKTLSYIAVGRGPGSYTGIRTGVAVAAGLSYGLKIPLVGFFSLESYVPNVLGKFHVIASAKSRGIYLLEGENSPDGATFDKEPFFSTHQLAHTHLKNAPLIVTPHYDEMNDLFTFKSLQKAIVNPSYLSMHCYRKYLKKDYSKDHKVDILYLHQPTTS